MKRLFIILLFLNPGFANAYTLQGEENTVAHGLFGYGVQIATYGFFKQFLLQGRKPDFEQKVMLYVFSTLVTGMVLAVKELGDDEKCRNSGNKQGCFDVGAIGYGGLGAAAAHLSIVAFEF